jgi:outer membrane scaffolding protein for murein synthesis (MipA/OmpV family)
MNTLSMSWPWGTLVLALTGLPAWAQSSEPASSAAPSTGVTAAPAEPEFRYLLGGQLRLEPTAAGAADRQTSLSPLFALRWGRWRIASSGASGMLGFERAAAGPGASTELLNRGPLRLGLGLRLDNGRKSADSDNTQGQPDVRRTLRLRGYASLALSPDWQWNTSLSPDLLGRGGGLLVSSDLGWRLWRRPGQELSLGLGLTAGNRRYMNSYFGQPEPGPDRYQAGAGLRDVHAGLGWLMALDRHWVLGSGLGVSRLLGPAADSPLTQRRNAWQASISVGWRN